MINKILEIIFPNVCGICGKIDKHNLCPQCKIKLKKLIKANITKMSNKNFTNHAYLFTYGGIIREKIIKYKFKDSAYLYKTFAEIIIKNKKMCGFIKNYDIIIPVPIHKKRYKERGYNQSEWVAKGIADVIGKEVYPHLLCRRKKNESQTHKSLYERWLNTHSAFYVQETSKIKDKHILLVDDVVTTGATLLACAEALLKSGNCKISLLTLAITQQNNK